MTKCVCHDKVVNQRFAACLGLPYDDESSHYSCRSRYTYAIIQDASYHDTSQMVLGMAGVIHVLVIGASLHTSKLNSCETLARVEYVSDMHEREKYLCVCAY